MAIEKSFQLYINEDNVKNYFTTSGGALNGAAIGGKYVTMRSSSTTATFTMNNAGRDVLFPSSAAKAHKIDVWAQSISTLNNSKNTINTKKLILDKPYLLFKLYREEKREYEYKEFNLNEDEAYSEALKRSENKIKNKLNKDEYIISKRI